MWIAWPASNPVWRFLAVRPAASSGINGSGLELRFVDYRGKRVLYQAHVPVLNVKYDGDACGPYRDWQFEEHCIQCDGTDVAPGFRWCRSAPQTACSGNDGGNFLIAGPDWQGETPPGITKVLRCETQFLYAFFRTQLFNPADLDNVKRIQGGYRVQPLSAFAGTAPVPLPKLNFIRPLSADEQKSSNGKLLDAADLSLLAREVQPSSSLNTVY